MQFEVPQFIEVEDKIFGPLTFKQFAYLVGGGGLSYLAYEFLPLYVAIFLIVPVAALAVALAFYRINDKPFSYIIQAATQYFLGSKLYVWKKEAREKREDDEIPAPVEETAIPHLSESRLKELSWSLGVKDSIYRDEQRG